MQEEDGPASQYRGQGPGQQDRGPRVSGVVQKLQRAASLGPRSPDDAAALPKVQVLGAPKFLATLADRVM